MKKHLSKTLLFGCFLFSYFGSFAQYNLPMINQYYTNPYLLNPAQAGGYDYPVAYLTYKNQWAGVSGNPNITSFTYNKPFLQSSGWGINIYNDGSGFLYKTEALFSFSQTAFIDAENQYLSFGISAGIIDQHINLGQVSGEIGKPVDPVAIAYNSNHPIYPDFDFGMAYRNRGLFVNLVFPNLVKFTQISSSFSSAYADNPLYFASISYSFPVGDDFDFEPMVASHQVKGIGNQWDISGLITYKGSVSLGVFYHNNQSYSVSLGYLFNRSWDFNYAYTQSASSIQQYFGGTNEISLGYHFSEGHQSRSSKNKLIRCPKSIN